MHILNNISKYHHDSPISRKFLPKYVAIGSIQDVKESGRPTINDDKKKYKRNAGMVMYHTISTAQVIYL